MTIIKRDCEHCIHHTSRGCSSWNCEFVSRAEAVKAVKTQKDAKK